MPVSFFYFALNYKFLKTRIMKKVFLMTVTAMFLLLMSEVNQLCAQSEFATARLLTIWPEGTTLFISIGNSDIEEIELKQSYHDKNHKTNFELDNKIINEKFSHLYSSGFRLVSTSTGDYHIRGTANRGREVIYLFAKE